MVVTDLDGTLFQKQQRVSAANLDALHRLGQERVLRVIATGRNLYSARKVLPREFPVDFVIFSTGAGIVDWPAQRLIRAVTMRSGELERAFRLLRGHRLDFMVHRPVPENHYFVYFASGRENPDFRARLGIYREFAIPGSDGALPMRRASQLLAIEPQATGEPPPRWGSAPAVWGSTPPDGPAISSLLEELRRELRGLNVVRTTSPLDGRSRWIEIFPAEVLKSLAASWLAARFGIDRSAVLALGNDFNDLDLLEWAPHGFLVGGAAPELLGRFPQVSTGGEQDFSAAVERWLREAPSPSPGRPRSGGPGAGP